LLFHSEIFLFVFLPVTWVVFTLLVGKTRAWIALTWLTLASLVFYAYWNPPYVVLIVSSVLVNFWVGRLVAPREERPASRSRGWVLFFGIAFNVALLGYFKYANFFVDNLNAVLGVGFNLERVILPLAISFFTFQQIAYLVDAYRGESHRYGFIEYSFFVTFFPQLIAGPIVRHSEIMPQIRAERFGKIRLLNLQVGLTIFLIGLFKKMVIADGAASYATPIFDAAADGYVFTTIDAWVGAIAYTVQLYFDFSGYSDMAIGLGRCFGLVLPLNFDAPYRATSIVDFWRRWHITLSRFLREYLYIPLGGNRKGVAVRYSNLMITMLLGGLWHGAGWTFVIWGGLHGLYLIVNHGFNTACGGFLKANGTISLLLRPVFWAITMVAVVIGWVFFRAADLGAALHMLAMMFPFAVEPAEPLAGELHRLLAGPDKLIWLTLAALIVFLLPTTHQYLRKYTPALGLGHHPRKHRIAWRPTLTHGLAMGCVLFLVFRRYFELAPTEFLYFNF